jgi:uncharacterized protein (TIGR03435 family)
MNTARHRELSAFFVTFRRNLSIQGMFRTVAQQLPLTAKCLLFALITMTSTLERYSDRPVVDMTGLTAVYDFSFDLTPEDSQIFGIRAALYAGVTLPEQVLKLLDTGAEPLIGAMQQLGLKLDARKTPVAVLVVDNALRQPVDK